MYKYSLLCFFCLFLIRNSHSQPYFPVKGDVYNDAVVPRIDVLIDPAYMDSILTPENVDSETEYPGTFIFSNGTFADTVTNTGLCMRGNTSREGAKKSFKVSFNTFQKGRKYKGFEKLNLNGERNDPCIIREKLYYEAAATMEIPAPYANHVALYINKEYKGLYLSIEHIDENFLKKRYGNNDGKLYKCLGGVADLEYKGANTSDYQFTGGQRQLPVYDLKMNEGADDFSDLIHFINVLNYTINSDFQAAIENVFNVNVFLKTLALDVATGNWDNYAYEANNYYLYNNPATGKFEYIPFDSDNSYGIDWVNQDWGIRNMYNWTKAGAKRKLVTRLMAFQEYKDRYSFYMNQLLSGMANPDVIFPVIDNLYSKIQSFAYEDQYRTHDYGFTWKEFNNAYIQPIDRLSFLPYGLKPFISQRYNSTKSQIVLKNVAPILSDLMHIPSIPHPGDTIYIKVKAEDESLLKSVTLSYTMDGGAWTTVALYDDGGHKDGLPNDGIWAGWLLPAATVKTINYSVNGTDVTNAISGYPRTGTQAIQMAPPPLLVINELMASNLQSVPDEYGEYDDWIEIYNKDSRPINLSTIYISDNPLNPGKFHLPDTILNPGAFLLIWADEQKPQGTLHANFKLSASAETVSLYEKYNGSFFLLDFAEYEMLGKDIPFGCWTDGIKPMEELNFSTPGKSNSPLGTDAHANDKAGFRLFPNPASDICNFEFQLPGHMDITIQLKDFMGRDRGTIFANSLPAGKHRSHFNLADRSLTPGVYFLSVRGADNEGKQLRLEKKLVVIAR